MNIRIYSPWKDLTNSWTNEYIRLNIFKYISLSEYSSHTVTDTLETLLTIRKFPDVESFQTVWNKYRQFENFPDNLEGSDSLETYQAIWKDYKLSGNFPDNMETFQTIWKFSRKSGNFRDNLVTCHTIWKPSILSRLYGKFPEKTRQFRNVQDNLKTFQTIQRLSRNFSDFTDKFRI